MLLFLNFGQAINSLVLDPYFNASVPAKHLLCKLEEKKLQTYVQVFYRWPVVLSKFVLSM